MRKACPLGLVKTYQIAELLAAIRQNPRLENTQLQNGYQKTVDKLLPRWPLTRRVRRIYIYIERERDISWEAQVMLSLWNGYEAL